MSHEFGLSSFFQTQKESAASEFLVSSLDSHRMALMPSLWHALLPIFQALITSRGLSMWLSLSIS
jgi:hypothetical protein